MPSECGQREHSDAVVPSTLDEPALQWWRTVEADVLGQYDLGDEEQYTGRVTVYITRQQRLLVKRGPGPAAGGEAALCNLLV